MQTKNFQRRNEKGYMLLAVMLLITVMLLALSVEVPRISQQIKREKEEELVHRGMDYARAVKRYYHKMNAYPVSLEQLEDTNHIRFLRKKYKDPITGEDDWKLVHMGEAEFKIPQTTGAVQGVNPGLQGSTTPAGQSPTGQAGLNPNPPTTPGGQTNQPGLQGQAGGGGSAGALKTTNIGLGNTGPQVGGGFIIGVASVSKKTGIKEFNDNSEYDEWLFVFDPRLEAATASNTGSANAGLIVAAPRAGGAASSGQGQPGTPGPSPSPTPRTGFR